MKTLRHGAAGLLLGLLAVTAAWLLANLVDSPARPTPPELAAAPPHDPPGNGFYALLALTVADGRDADADGRALWAREADASRLAQIRAGDIRGAVASAAVPGIDVSAVHPPSGPPAVCTPQEEDCVDAWLAAPDALAAALQPAAPAWSRCQALFAQPVYAEQVHDSVAAVLPTHTAYRGIALCARLAAQHAAVAVARGQLPAAARTLAQGRRWLDAVEGGSRSAVAAGIAARSQRLLQRSAVLLAAAHSAVLPALADAGYPLQAAPGALHLRTWMQHERMWQSHMLGHTAAGCHGAGGWFEVTGCHLLFGLPNQTQQDVDAMAVRELRLVTERGLVQALADLPRHTAVWSWRNTWSRTTSDASSALRWMGPRHADADLERAVAGLALGLSLARVPEAERGRWLAEQAPAWFRPQDAALQSARIRLADDQVRAEPWSSMALPIALPIPLL